MKQGKTPPLDRVHFHVSLDENKHPEREASMARHEGQKRLQWTRPLLSNALYNRVCHHTSELQKPDNCPDRSNQVCRIRILEDRSWWSLMKTDGWTRWVNKTGPSLFLMPTSRERLFYCHIILYMFWLYTVVHVSCSILCTELCYNCSCWSSCINVEKVGAVVKARYIVQKVYKQGAASRRI